MLRFTGRSFPTDIERMPRRATIYAGDVVPIRKNTQEEQNRQDEEKRRQVINDLIQSWLDRLQLISVITTFFASTEAGLLSITTPSAGDASSILEDAANAGILGGLIMHTNAAVISFLAAFVLVRYKLHEVKEEESETLGDVQVTTSPTSESPRVENGKSHAEEIEHLRNRVEVSATSSDARSGPSEQRIWSSNPHLVQVGPLFGEPPTQIIERCHALCVFLSAVGFILALMGITTFAWARFSRSVQVVATACTAFCTVAGILVVLVPDSSNIKPTNRYKVPPRQ